MAWCKGLVAVEGKSAHEAEPADTLLGGNDFLDQSGVRGLPG